MTPTAPFLSNVLLGVAAISLLAACAADPVPTDPTPSPTAVDAADRAQPGGGGGDVAADPDAPVAGGGGPAMPPVDDGALQVRPEPGIVDARPHAWHSITVAPDGRTITIDYVGGVQDCYGLAAVRVQRDDDGLLHVTVLEGRRADLPPDTACIEIGVFKSVTVELDEPLVAPAD